MKAVFKNFHISQFNEMLKESFVVSGELLLQFNADTKMIISCSFSGTKSLTKLWTTPIANICETESDFETFNVYFTRGKLLQKVFQAHKTETADLTFELQATSEGNTQAVFVNVASTNGSIRTSNKVELTTEEMISPDMRNYDKVIDMCKPKEGMYEFAMGGALCESIIKDMFALQYTVSNNTPYINFEIDPVSKTLSISDKSFNVEYPLSDNDADTLPETKSSFSLMRKDFLGMGKHDLIAYFDNDSKSVVFLASEGGMVIGCHVVKVDDNSTLYADGDLGASDILESSGAAKEYFGDFF